MENQDKILGPQRKPQMKDLPGKVVVPVIKAALFGLDTESYGHRQNTEMRYNIRVDATSTSLAQVDITLCAILSLEDLRTRSSMLPHLLNRLRCTQLYLLQAPHHEAELQSYRIWLEEQGYTVTLGNGPENEGIKSFGFDSIAGLSHLFHTHPYAKNCLSVRLFAPGDAFADGYPSALSAGNLYKPYFYGLEFLSQTKGQLVYQSHHCVVIRTQDVKPRHFIMVNNYHRHMSDLCTHAASYWETQSVLDSFIDEVDVKLMLGDLTGPHLISTQSIQTKNTFFELYSKLDFPRNINLMPTQNLEDFLAPDLDIRVESIHHVLNLAVSHAGPGVTIICVEPLP